MRPVEAVRDVAGLRAAFPRAQAAGEPALFVPEAAFDTAEAMPPHSERPERIRERFHL